jgi:hypothetical protein
LRLKPQRVGGDRGGAGVVTASAGDLSCKLCMSSIAVKSLNANKRA